MEPVVLRTRRLTLRPLGPGDLTAVHAYASDPENTRYMLRLPNGTLAETRAFLEAAGAEWAKEQPGFYEFAVLLEGTLIGAVSLYLQEGGREAELGWILNKRCWGLGLATEAAGELVRFAREALHLRGLVAHCDTENEGSRRVMEKLGMARIGEFGGRYSRQFPEERREYLYELAL